MPSVAEILLAQGARSADARRRLGEIQAQTWQSVGNIAGQTIQTIGNQYAQQKADEPRKRAEALQLAGLEAEAVERAGAAQSRESFQQTLSSGRSRAEILKALESNPEQYRMASEHFERIDTGYKRLMGDVAAGVRAFGDTPEAALIAIDDLIAKGFDERQMEQFRAAIQKDPTSVSTLIDGLLQSSPDEGHRKMVMPKKEAESFTLSPGQTRFGPDGKPIAEVEAKPEAEKTFTVTVRGPGGRPMKRVFTESELRTGVEEYREPSAPRSAPARFWVLRNGEPVRISEAEYQQGDRPAGGAAGTGRPATGAQNRVLGFFNRAQQADTDLEAFESEVQNMNLGEQAWMATMPNVLQSETGKAYTQAQRAFTEARLRKDSGAAVPPHEYAADRKTYFAQPGDSKQTLEQKRRARAAILASLAYEAGPALSGFLGDEGEAARVIQSFKERASGAAPTTATVGGAADLVYDPVSKKFVKAGGR